MMRKLLFKIAIGAIAIIALGFMVPVAQPQQCSFVLERKGAEPLPMETQVMQTILAYNNPKFFLQNKGACDKVKLIRKDTTSLIPLSRRQYGSGIKFWPQAPLALGEYTLIVGEKEYPLLITREKYIVY
jgi:hypothetical protein